MPRNASSTLTEAELRLMKVLWERGPLTPAEYAVYSAIFELEAASPTRIAARSDTCRCAPGEAN